MEDLDKIKVCVAYKYKNKIYKEFPASRTIQKYAEPVYEEMPGFNGRVKDVTNFKSLPINAQKYIRRLEELVGASIDLVSIGRKREEIIEINKDINWF